MSPEITGIIAAIEFAAQRGLRHLVNDDGQNRIALWRDVSTVPAAKSAPQATRAAHRAAPVIAQAHAVDTVTAPLPGICHLSPDTGSPPFTQEGARVEAGQTLCIIEAMKVMTAVPARHAGTVTRIHPANGATVLAGDKLMDIRA